MNADRQTKWSKAIATAEIRTIRSHRKIGPTATRKLLRTNEAAMPAPGGRPPKCLDCRPTRLFATISGAQQAAGRLVGRHRFGSMNGISDADPLNPRSSPSVHAFTASTWMQAKGLISSFSALSMWVATDLAPPARRRGPPSARFPGRAYNRATCDGAAQRHHARYPAISAATKSMNNRARSGGVRPKAWRKCKGTRSSCR